MIIIAKTNDHYYNMIEIQKFEKIDDTIIKFYFANGNVSIEKYSDKDTRDKAFSNLESEFVKDIDN